MTPSRQCILIGINNKLYDRFGCSYGGSVQEAQLKKQKK